ncbi:hypothetical protein NliqN6_6347 [Naganishia liquefaciens]|uniref:CRAL-TRIO domain-containing protein n=1 Tax=Naganishia liquefaciens TaxID=104408 RepID=A0A8H3TZ90_9TREE|nr:hypothetical protein NliqN6_6347 [Naganishia liquefaciens]
MISQTELAALLATPKASVTLPTGPAQATPEQETNIAHLKAYYTPSSSSSSSPNSTSPCLPLTPAEQLFLSRETLLRFLIATRNDLASTRTRLDKCLTWRRSMRIDEIHETAEVVAPEAVCGKEFVIGYSSKGQPVLHFCPNRSDTKESERQLRHVVYMLERTADLMPGGVSNLVLIIDFAGKKSAPTSPGMAKQFISVLQDFYPERLGTAVLLSIPWIVRKFLDFAFTFVDPVTKAKVRWHVDVVKEGIVPADEAIKDYGGDVDFTYNQDAYWDLLRDTALAKRAEYLAHWEHLGGGVGQSEWEFKQPLPASPNDSRQTAVPTTATSQFTGRTAVSTPVRSESVSSEATIHENHGVGIQSVEKAVDGMVIREDASSVRLEVVA